MSTTHAFPSEREIGADVTFVFRRSTTVIHDAIALFVDVATDVLARCEEWRGCEEDARHHTMKSNASHCATPTLADRRAAWRWVIMNPDGDCVHV
jgi:hypothetical protein